MKKKKKAQDGQLITWKPNKNAQYNFQDEALNKEIYKRKAGSSSHISREDHDRFNLGTLTHDHPLMNMLKGHREKVLHEFKKDKTLKQLHVGDLNLSLLPQMIQNGKEQGALGSGSGFDIISRGYGNPPATEEYLPVNQETSLIAPKKKVLQPGEYPTFQRKKNMKAEEVPYGNVLGRAYGLKHGGIIEDDRGYWNPANHGKAVKINSNKITMKGVNQPLLGISNKGDKKLMRPNKEYKFKGSSVTEYPLAQYGNSIPENTNMFNTQVPQTNWGSENIFAPGQFTPEGQASQFNASLPQQQDEMFGGAQGIADTATSLLGGFQFLKQDRENRNEAKKFYKLAKLTNQVSGLAPDKVKRKYVRPEDQVLDPDQNFPTYGVGTNYLEDGGKIKLQNGGMFDQFGNFIGGLNNPGNVGSMLGSALGGGKGVPSGSSMIGSTIGGVAGGLLGPVGGAVGKFLGGAIGGLIGGKTQRETARYQRKGENQLASAAFQQGSNALHNQYTGFMEDGGTMGGDLKTHWGGDAIDISQNPYLPDGGETVMFRGASHDNGGIGASFGNSPVEVEGGEPAVKLEDGGKSGLTVFGNMKIPSYGISELGDEKAKGKKFKNYINDLSKVENKQNKTVNKALTLIDENDNGTPFDKLKMSSGEALLTGADMTLKDIAKKKRIASGIQNAILETADELGLKSDELAKGKIKKAKMGAKIAQDGGRIARAEVQNYLDKGWVENPNNPNQLMLISETPGRTEYKDVYSAKGSKEYNNWFKDNYSKNKGKVIDSPWGKMLMELGKRTDKTVIPGTRKEDYLDIYDPEQGGIQGIYPDPTQGAVEAVSSNKRQRGNFDPTGLVNSVLPFLRPSNQLPLSANQLSGEMYALSTNQLEPVQAQLYNPLLENVSDISLQDQLNANQSDFNSIQRSVGNNPAAIASLAGQKYAANTNVLGEQFRLNQGQKQNVYNRNRGVLNDATLKNLAILDQQYVRQSTAKSNTKATAQAALNSISDKIAKNKLENRTLGIYENLYNYRFGPKGYAYNMNPLADFQIPSNLSALPTYVDDLVPEGKEAEFNSRGQLKDVGTKAKPKKGFRNGAMVQYLKSY